MSTISKVELNLGTYSIYNPATQAFEDATVKGNLYTVAGVTDGTSALRKLSMGELVMVVCLARAADKEAAIINLMKEMENTTKLLEALTEIEKKLLDGKSLSQITGEWSYNGTTYTTATDLLGAIGVITINSSRQTLVTLAAQLENNSVFDLTGSYDFNGTTYSNAYQLLMQTGCLTRSFFWGAMSATRPVAIEGHCWGETAWDAYAYAKELVDKGSTSLSSEDRNKLWATYGLNYNVPFTSKTMGYVVENMFYNAEVSRNLNALISSTPAVVGNPSTDQIITEIESKMDSLNSFSQQKMIELQSETNKRDQAYDMITNILKSLNTVQVGIVNNM